MKSRVIQIAVLGFVAWLFLTDSGRQRRDQALQMLRQSRAGGDGSNNYDPQRQSNTVGQERSASVPWSLPATTTQEAPTGEHPSPTSTGGDGSPAIPAAPITAPEMHERSRASSNGTVEPEQDEDRSAVAVPSGQAATSNDAPQQMAAAGAPSRTASETEEDVSAANTRPQMQTDGRGADMAATASPVHDEPSEQDRRLEEVLEQLTEEMETRAIGQDPDVKVEEELDRGTLEEIGIPEES